VFWLLKAFAAKAGGGVAMFVTMREMTDGKNGQGTPAC